ncbi:hypothetical protein BC939DRAFT_10595 [Gamsiella multidivaricata]|uniref:uncharacterized protein n=1 Tax=Gamsiella multidivaricata TaxID=101098 RepID=UPI002220C8DC|nr:uncharacterized protein BC939DRAFT_10595 [Gamsiella multidivaricata]KAI7829535.1 hypothetical protein BC939DRAFT_10595 [Gamsiella multidivaricata]
MPHHHDFTRCINISPLHARQTRTRTYIDTTRLQHLLLKSRCGCPARKQIEITMPEGGEHFLWFLTRCYCESQSQRTGSIIIVNQTFLVHKHSFLSLIARNTLHTPHLIVIIITPHTPPSAHLAPPSLFPPPPSLLHPALHHLSSHVSPSHPL